MTHAESEEEGAEKGIGNEKQRGKTKNFLRVKNELKVKKESNLMVAKAQKIRFQ